MLVVLCEDVVKVLVGGSGVLDGTTMIDDDARRNDEEGCLDRLDVARRDCDGV